MSEFSLIDRYCTNIGTTHTDTRVGVGDDAAVLSVPSGHELVVSVDTMVEGVHFLANVDPADLAHKLIAVNISDMAAMGAQAKWATLAVTLPTMDHAWLEPFSQGLHRAAMHNSLQLVGGDTTAGSLTLSMQIIGLVPTGQALKRCGAQVGDDVYVSGRLGDAALALSLIQTVGKVDDHSLAQALHQPLARSELGVAIRGLAHAAIDVSDGLVADLAHIARGSNVCIVLQPDAVPVSNAFKQAGAELDLALYGGDDYELAFTCSADDKPALLEISRELDLPITCVGHVQEPANEPVLLVSGSQLSAPSRQAGYTHFEQ